MSAKHNKNELSRNQLRAIKALLEHKRISDAADAAGISERTIYRWLRDPRFNRALSQAEGESISEAVRILVVDLSENHDVMREIRDDRDVPNSVRLRAAQLLDNSLLRWREIQDIEARLTALEFYFYDKKP